MFVYDIIPSLTVGKNKNGRKASKYRLCGRFCVCNDMCYFYLYDESIFLVCFIMFLIVDFLMNS